MEVIGRALPGRNENPLLAGIGLLHAAVEEIRHVGVFLGLGEAQVRDSSLGPDVGEDVREVLGGKGDRKAKLFLVFRKADEVQRRRLRPRKVGELGLGQSPRDLTGPVGSEVEEDDGVAVPNGPDRLASLENHGRLYELVGFVAAVSGVDGLYGAPGLQARGENHGGVRTRDAVPAFVAVHRVVAARNGRDAAAGFRERGLEARDVGLRRSRRRIAPVGEDVHAQARHRCPLRQRHEALQMPFVRVDPAVGDQAHQVQSRAFALRVFGGGQERFVREEGAVTQGEVDPQEILGDHPSRAEREMPDLGVAHDSGGQADGLAGSLEQRPGMLPEPPVEDRRARKRDGVGIRGWSMAPAVADQQENGSPLQGRAAGREGFPRTPRARAGPGSRRSRSETTCMKAM